MESRGLDEHRLRRLLEVGRALVSQLDREELLRRVLEVARELTGARYAAIGILDADRVELERFLTVGIDDETHRAIGDLPRGRGILGELIREPKPLRLSDISEHVRSYGFPPAHPPMTTFLGAPVLIRGEAWGNIYLTEKEDGEFDELDEEALVVLAEWVAIAIENARLYEGIESRRKELERAVSGLEATTTLARAIGGETDLTRVLELVVKRGRALIEARVLLVLLGEGDELVVSAAAG
jgi:GAF domain-containing protein